MGFCSGQSCTSYRVSEVYRGAIIQGKRLVVVPALKAK
jgi:hypothetical protein